jgi:hypothetical protein
MRMMTGDEAREYRKAHDARARMLTRMKVAALRGIAARAGVGAAGSKDELVSLVLSAEFPVEKMNESIHVSFHAPGERWDACVFCQPAFRDAGPVPGARPAVEVGDGGRTAGLGARRAVGA